MKSIENKLVGVWNRLDISRKHTEWKKHTGTEVWYVQNPSSAFIDVRRLRVDDGLGEPKTMAFSGITTIDSNGTEKRDDADDNAVDEDDEMIVRWHAFYDASEAFVLESVENRWRDAIQRGRVPPTDDVGQFVRSDDRNIWVETDPDRTLRETWKRVTDGRK